MQIFSKLVVEILKKLTPPIEVTFKCPRVVVEESFQNHLEIGVGKGKSCLWGEERRGEERRGEERRGEEGVQRVSRKILILNQRQPVVQLA